MTTRERNDPALRNLDACTAELERLATDVFLAEDSLPADFFPAMAHLTGDALRGEHWRLYVAPVFGSSFLFLRVEAQSIKISAGEILVRTSSVLSTYDEIAHDLASKPGFRGVMKLIDKHESLNVDLYVKDPINYTDKPRDHTFKISPRSSYSAHQMMAIKKRVR